MKVNKNINKIVNDYYKLKSDIEYLERVSSDNTIKVTMKDARLIDMQLDAMHVYKSCLKQRLELLDVDVD